MMEEANSKRIRRIPGGDPRAFGSGRAGGDDEEKRRWEGGK